MNVIDTDLPDVKILEPVAYADERGFFFEVFNAERWPAALGPAPVFVQQNHSRSTRGVLRGLHWQARPSSQDKLVRVVAGAVQDVVVDIRPESPHFGRWTTVTLSAANRRQLWVPQGHAHGFLALEDDSDTLYDVTSPYRPATERTLAWDDPSVGIQWPLLPGQSPILSAKDRQGLRLQDLKRAPPS
ncbi:dTDP-4-dehydrorhamnose 3,5-epimerase [plant metagenome]|uniref:dTDP-4-dehydrorhamnose 3,5-epimerase n=1 Tax=plant metagenome TaxID=1297885 RepID=A0A484QXK3_9ZZZZ